jgi:hypothetical protein
VHRESASNCNRITFRRSRRTYPHSTALCNLPFPESLDLGLLLHLTYDLSSFSFHCHLFLISFHYEAYRNFFLDVGMLNAVNLRVIRCPRPLEHYSKHAVLHTSTVGLVSTGARSIMHYTSDFLYRSHPISRSISVCSNQKCVCLNHLSRLMTMHDDCASKAWHGYTTYSRQQHPLSLTISQPLRTITTKKKCRDMSMYERTLD